MVAIGVIIAAVVGASTLIITSITAGRISQNRVEAANFAREGIEIVRAMRDSNWLKFEQNETAGGTIPTWNTGLGAAVDTPVYRILSFSYGTTNVWSLSVCWPFGPCSTARSGIYRVTNSTAVWHAQYLSLNHCNTSLAGNNCVLTKYSRLITLTNKLDDVSNTPGDTTDDRPYLLVESKVSWNDRTGAKSLVAQTRLYDWK